MQKLKGWLQNPYIVLYIVFSYFLVFAFIVDTPYEIFRGLIAIVLSYDILITDYVEVGGVGATLVNAALVNLILLVVFHVKKYKPCGALIMSFWLLAGFTFFGKNIANVWLILFGGILYAKFRREPFEKFAVVTMLATALGPSVTQIAMLEHIDYIPRMALAAGYGLFIGFAMPSISSNIFNVHHGFNLYNVGFTAGILAILTRIFIVVIGGPEIVPVFIWSTQYWLTLSIFMFILFSFLTAVGIFTSENSMEKFKALLKCPGQAPCDYYADYAEVTYINMGLLGISTTAVMLAIGSDINGAVMGSIFTVVAFGSIGKHMKNIWPVMIGCLLAGGFLQIWNGTSPSASIAVLLVTCLAPVAGKYGWKWGVVAGFIHLNIAAHVVTFSGGFNLYNNGLAGGFVAMLLIPLIKMLHECKTTRTYQKH
jgi:hypothetical protein